jgi:sarcosine oxidase
MRQARWRFVADWVQPRGRFASAVPGKSEKPMQTYDRIVLGLGGAGSAALWQLARRGVRVLGLEQFTAAHDRGSSHGHTRIIRQAYFEHSMYVPLLLRAYELWGQIEHLVQKRLFCQVGLLEVGPPDGVVLPGIERSVAEHGLQLERFSSAELARRFSSFRIPPGMQAVFEPTAGFLFVEQCVAACLDLARREGAIIHWQTPVTGIDWGDADVVVHTATDSFRAGGLICCAGAWSPALLPQLPPMRVLRKHLHWLAADPASWHVDAGCPVFFFEMPEGYFYGFPAVDSRGVKLAEHSGGEIVEDPAHLRRDLDECDLARVRAFAAKCLPTVAGPETDHAVCMYTMTPDEHFVVDVHPDHSRVVIAAGLSGHGFKFASVLGEILAQLSLDGGTSLPIDPLRMARFQH